MPFHYKGQTFDAVPREKMTPGEIDWVERVTGLTYKKITFLAERCVCEHLASQHLHFKDVEGQSQIDVEDQSCRDAACPCDGFDPDLPSRVTYAFLLVAAKRHDPTINWDDAMNAPQDEWSYERGESPDPTEPPSQEG